ncbi:DgyrCDS9865 [Dimorphilus gyrociliatus]|uniref:Transcription initiation factor TFIID subunit 8 n=1 Tax=Dimorphilus gyrociliatus TaxID=2664684 RepID=A0A7I8W0H0_9ANNE|nr:DgyrCDS9865 [Dimorphilus gyrociliatus]
MSSTEKDDYDVAIQKALKASIGAILQMIGFEAANPIALSTLTEMLRSYLTEIGKQAKMICEAANRTEPIISDISLALIEMGNDITKIEDFSKRPMRLVNFDQATSTTKPPMKTLRVGQRPDMPGYVPSYLPSFPDPHTYMSRQPDPPSHGTYAELREKAASQKRDVERALTTLIAKTGETDLIFEDDPLAFPLIANAKQPLPYIDALLPKEYDTVTSEETGTDANSDNPYLRPIKMPQLKKKGKTFIPIK